MANKLTTILDASFVGSAAYKTAQNHVAGFEGKMNAARKTSIALETQMTSLGKRILSMGAAYAGFRISKDIINTASEFQKQMSDVATLISGDATEAIDTLSGGIKGLMAEIPKSADDLGASAYSIFSAGITDTAEALDVLKNSAILAVAGLGTTAEATDLMTSSINAFASEGLEAAHISDLIFTTVKMGKTTVSELAQGFGSVAASAAGANVKLDELLAATSALTTTGLPATVAYVQLTAAMKGLLNPTDAMSKLLDKIGFESGQVAIEQIGLVATMQKLTEAADGNNAVLIEAFGRIEGFKAAIALAGANSEAFKTTLDDMRDGINNVNEAFDKQNETFEATFMAFKNNIDIVKISVGDKLIPTLKSLLDTFNQNQAAIMGLIDISIKLGLAMGGAYMVGKIRAFGAAMAITLKATQAEMLVTQTRAAVMATSMGTSMAATRFQFAQTSVTAGVLRKAVNAIPAGVWITIGLIGAQVVISKIQEVRRELAALTKQRIDQNKSLEDEFSTQKDIYDDAKKQSGELGVIEMKRLNLIELRAKATAAARTAADSFSASEVSAAQKKLEVIEGFYKKEEAAIESLEAKLTESEKNKLEIIRSSRAGSGEAAAAEDFSNLETPDFVGGGGGGGGAGDDKADEEAEKIIAAQKKIYDSLFKTKTGFSDLRLAGVDALADLEAEHEKSMEAMIKKTDDLLDQLNALNEAYATQVKGFDQSAAEQVIAQEETIKELQKQVSEESASGEDVSELKKRLEQEKAALRKFLAENKDLEDEIAVARKRAALTDFQRYVEDLNLKREAAMQDFTDKQAAIVAELDALQKQREDEQVIYEGKRDAIQKINDQIRDNWSSIMDDMEKRTEQFAILAEAKLNAIKAAFEAVKNITGDVSSADLRTASEYLPEGTAEAISNQSSQNNISLNLNVEVGSISTQAQLDDMMSQVEGALARSADLIGKNVSATPSI